MVGTRRRDAEDGGGFRDLKGRSWWRRRVSRTSVLFPPDSRNFPGRGAASGGGRGRQGPLGLVVVMGRCFKGRLCSGRRRGKEVISVAVRASPSRSPRPLRPAIRPRAPSLPRPLQEAAGARAPGLRIPSSHLLPPHSWEPPLLGPSHCLKGARREGWRKTGRVGYSY